MNYYVVGGPILPIKAKALIATHPTARFMTSKLRKFTDLYPSVSSIPEIVKVSQAALLVFAVLCQCLFVCYQTLSARGIIKIIVAKVSGL